MSGTRLNQLFDLKDELFRSRTFQYDRICAGKIARCLLLNVVRDDDTAGLRQAVLQFTGCQAGLSLRLTYMN